MAEKRYETDVLVIGGGIAGCFAAIKAREYDVNVLLIDKGYTGSSGQTPFANTFTVFNSDWGDDLEQWMQQINMGGDYLNNRKWTEITLKDSYPRYLDLASYGVPFFMDKENKPYRSGLADLGPCLCVFPDNKVLSAILRNKAIASGAKILDRIMVTDLIKNGEHITGAVGITVTDAEFCVIKAKAVIICTGASGFKPTGWPISNLTSDGDVMAYRAGASITGKEFIDTHGSDSKIPAYVGPPFLKRSLHSAPPPTVYSDATGAEYKGLSVFHLGPEYVVHSGRGPIDTELPHGRCKLVGGASAGMSTHKAEGIWPADYCGGTEIPGLYAAGDSLGTMLSGAAYSAIGLALAGSAVTGAIAGVSAAEYVRELPCAVDVAEEIILKLKKNIYAPLERIGGYSPSWVIKLLQNTMIPYYTMIIKHRERLSAALTMIEFYQEHLAAGLKANDAHEIRLAIETKNMLCNAEMKLRASLFREESRGTHYREDFPERDEIDWNAWIRICQVDGKMLLTKEPIPKGWVRTDSNKFLFEFPRFKGGLTDGDREN
ncbi:FAD-binding protein [Bacillota bacterium]